MRHLYASLSELKRGELFKASCGCLYKRQNSGHRKAATSQYIWARLVKTNKACDKMHCDIHAFYRYAAVERYVDPVKELLDATQRL